MPFVAIMNRLLTKNANITIKVKQSFIKRKLKYIHIPGPDPGHNTRYLHHIPGQYPRKPF